MAAPNGYKLPCVTPVPGGFVPGSNVKITGTVKPNAIRFFISFHSSANTNPFDDIALHANFRYNDMFVARNSLINKQWGKDEIVGGMPVKKGEDFCAFITCGEQIFRMELNGQQFCEYKHRIPPKQISHVTVDGDVVLKSVVFNTTGQATTAPASKPAAAAAVTGSAATATASSSPTTAGSPKAKVRQPCPGCPPPPTPAPSVTFQVSSQEEPRATSAPKPRKSVSLPVQTTSSRVEPAGGTQPNGSADLLEPCGYRYSEGSNGICSLLNRGTELISGAAGGVVSGITGLFTSHTDNQAGQDSQTGRRNEDSNTR